MTQEEQLLSQKAEEERLVRVPIPTFPPTAMVFSVDPRHGTMTNGDTSTPKDTVPMSLIAKVLAQGPARKPTKRAYLCTNCLKDTVVADKASQANLLLDHSLVIDRPPGSIHGFSHQGGTAATLYRTNSSDAAAAKSVLGV